MSDPNVPKKIGVFGGTFDPIHSGHIAVGRAVRDELELDRVLLVVNSDQWLRDNPPSASVADRFAMVKLAVEHEIGMEVSDVDIARGGSTYTVDTLSDLRQQLGSSVELHLVVGADSALSMDRWRDCQQMKQLAKIVAVGRPGQQFDSGLLDSSHPASGAEYLEGPMIDISATGIRELIDSNRSVDQFLTPAVATYIKSHNLYQ
ncbi:MAG TPA: nicotinate (nicotinamide) nucleotide adenylyltransferase [Dehalococcoidia bacterium]|nr:nicotinate (nicotinamide) nucleotide adenylyltransferase [Chloroflexota bacterium]HCI85428.1 nicotinate (nicotinamide) nucleotide adenylyltransferase [Dehalococcoidia bacterium]|tara:strand:+ start:1824 stop:2435 length:612 start_codon:yes stop_codon:yes gene_type:complete